MQVKITILNIILDVKISKKMAQSTAISVINRHRTQKESPIVDQSTANQSVAAAKNQNRNFPGHPHLLLASEQKKINDGISQISFCTKIIFSVI